MKAEFMQTKKINKVNLCDLTERQVNRIKKSNPNYYVHYLKSGKIGIWYKIIRRANKSDVLAVIRVSDLI